MGELRGTEASGTRYYGVDISMINAKELRTGEQLVGDKFLRQGRGASGTWDGYSVATHGYRGVEWMPHESFDNFTGGYPTWGLKRVNVEPTATFGFPISIPGGKCFRCFGGLDLSRSGTTASILSANDPGYGSLLTISGLSGMSGADLFRFLEISNASVTG